jgi:hypothetical protein
MHLPHHTSVWHRVEATVEEVCRRGRAAAAEEEEVCARSNAVAAAEEVSLSGIDGGGGDRRSRECAAGT